MQQGNHRLTCWNSWKSSGPDEKSALNIHLEYPALSMTLLPMSKGIVYGSCRNGYIYIARVVGETISVEYLHLKQPEGTVHIGTFAEIKVDQAKGSGRKRKLSDADGNSSVNFYQAFCDGVSIKVVRNIVSLSISNSEKLIKSGSLIQNAASVCLFNDELSDYRGQHTLDRAELLISSSGSAPKISVIYTVSNNSTSASQTEKIEDPSCGTFCVAISLANGEIANNPVRLPSETTQFGLVTETVLAAASSEMIHLYDLMTGSMLQSSSLKRAAGDLDDNDDWVLHTNDKHGILALLFRREEHLHVALSTAALDESKGNLSSNTIKSSSKLACSLLACRNERPQSQMKMFDQISITGGNKDKSSSSALIRMDESVARALTTLEETLSQGDKSRSNTSFREVFDASVSTLMKDINGSNQETEFRVANDSNPQDPSNGELKALTKVLKHGKLNGRCSSTKTRCRKIPPSIPQSFIDGSLQIALSIILKERQAKNSSAARHKLGLDARYVLKDLIQSRRVSARRHFEGSYALQETEKEHPLSKALKALGHPSAENPLSALQMILEIIVNCSDLSERHLVIMLNYMVRHAKADGIVDTVRHQHADTPPKEYAFVKGNEKKTIIAGVKAVLQMIVGYSECNEAMLRVALVEELSSPAEAVILARMLPKLLMSNPYSSNRAPYFVRSACQWIAALSESFRDDLSWAKTSCGESHLALLLDSVEKISKTSQALMSLKDSIGVAEMIHKQKRIRARKGVSESPQTEEMWGYSIDHIIF
jgi:hypothetical protein